MSNFLKTLGPGLMFASTTIGVSHLVQSTRAGALYGFGLIGIIFLVNLFKYPFFEYGNRYANVKGKSIVDGYLDIGKWMLWLYFIITLSSMFFVTAAIGMVTSGFFENLLGTEPFIPIKNGTVILVFAVSSLLLIIGGFKTLDGLIKIIGITLFITTIVAFFAAIFKGSAAEIKTPENLWSNESIPFIIALMGWMPCALDLSSWNSLWTVEKIKNSDYKPSVKETINEFAFGYWITALLSLCFVTLGAYVMFGTGKELSSSSALFAGQVIEMYTKTIGNWSGILIATAAFSIMFGTTIGLLDGYSRTLDTTTSLLFKHQKNNTSYRLSLVATVLGGLLVIYIFPSDLKKLVDFATTVSFMIAPIIAMANFYLVMKNFKKEARPNVFLQLISYLGILFLTGFGMFYLWFTFM